jgi:tryptophan 2,3-dioxygenase
LLLEAAVACGVLAVGLVGVMQSFAMQRRAVTANAQMTQMLLVLQTCTGAVYAGVRPDQGSCSGTQVRRTSRDEPLGISGLKQVHLALYSGGSSGESRSLVFYVRDSSGRGLE